MPCIGENIKNVQAEIKQACIRVGRKPEEVKLIVVSKMFSAQVVKEAYDEGQQLFGENKVQELMEKRQHLPTDISWHLIGTLQRNKVKYIVGNVDLIHSVDSLKLAREISKHAMTNKLEVDVLIQVNIAEEDSKCGYNQEIFLQEIKDISELPGIKIKGLMTIAPYTTEPEEVRPVFRQLRLLAEKVKDLELPGVEMKELSMGMSGDFQVAIEEGATLVRIGSRIFGERNY